MTICGCGINFNNPVEASTHRETCGEPQVNMEEAREFEMGIDLGLDLCYAVGYVRVDKRTGQRRMLSAAR